LILTYRFNQSHIDEKSLPFYSILCCFLLTRNRNRLSGGSTSREERLVNVTNFIDPIKNGLTKYLK